MSQIGRGMPRARSMDEYKEMLKEVLYEIQEVKATAEFDDYMNDAVLIAESMRPELEAILKDVESGNIQFGSELSFMQNTQRMPTEIIPFKALLARISDKQKNGIEERKKKKKPGECKTHPPGFLYVFVGFSLALSLHPFWSNNFIPSLIPGNNSPPQIKGFYTRILSNIRTSLTRARTTSTIKYDCLVF